MARGGLDDLRSFAAVARQRSFTRAAAALGTSTSSLSHSLRRLETALGVRLLARTSRSVALTQAGERLLDTIEPALAAIGAGLEAARTENGRVAGAVRLTATREGYERVVRPALPGFLRTHPAATVEVSVDAGFRDVVAGRFDAGIRSGEDVPGDMVALRVGGDLRMAVVAAPGYLAAHGAPAEPRDLASHRCIGYRLRSTGAGYAWEFSRRGRAFTVAVPEVLLFDDPGPVLDCAADGLGIGYVLEDASAAPVRDGRLVRLLPDWTVPFPGFFLFWPSRRQQRPVFAAFVDAVRSAARDRG